MALALLMATRFWGCDYCLAARRCINISTALAALWVWGLLAFYLRAIWCCIYFDIIGYFFDDFINYIEAISFSSWCRWERFALYYRIVCLAIYWSSLTLPLLAFCRDKETFIAPWMGLRFLIDVIITSIFLSIFRFSPSIYITLIA